MSEFGNTSAVQMLLISVLCVAMQLPSIRVVGAGMSNCALRAAALSRQI